MLLWRNCKMRKRFHLFWILSCLILVSYLINQQVYDSDTKPVRKRPHFHKYKKEANLQVYTTRLESTSLHDFKSIFIQDLKTYNIKTTKKVPGNRKTKIISCFGCAPWFQLSWFCYQRNFKACPYKECFFDKSGKYQQKADAVLFFLRTYKDNRPKRPPGQIWINYVWEATPQNRARYNEHYHLWKDVFNWTAGYSTDNDFFWPHGYLGWRAKEDLLSDNDYLYYAKQKSKTAVLWSSHCDTQSNRLAYVQEMQKYVDVDIYGTCGDLHCEGWESCAPMLNHTYKFYLAFENSFCKDYITEKFFRCFQDRRFIVPVTRGGVEYEKHFPHGTFINGKDFKNAKELALYLKAIANDIPKYAEFLKQKDKLTTLSYRIDWCDMCERLHTNDKQKTIPDINRVTLNKSLCWQVNDII